MNAPARMEASGEPTLQAPQRSLPQIIQVLLVEDGLDRERQLRQLGAGLDPVGEGDEDDPENRRMGLNVPLGIMLSIGFKPAAWT
jgi:hypothetical protein